MNIPDVRLLIKQENKLMNEACNHFWTWRPHIDGMTKNYCTRCENWGDPVMKSGYGGSPYGPCSGKDFVFIMPRRPIFHDPVAEVAWFRKHIAERSVAGQYVSPEMWRAAA